MRVEENVQAIIKKIIREKFLISIDIKDDDNLTEIGIDSMKVIKLVIDLEEQFGFEFEDEKLTYDTLHSINSIAAYVYERLKKKGDERF
ncbi:MAG: acyl carrier protein [Lachnospiraceae bacterium]|nr:acyl carrier protein [Lachnospiraceae bacterium]